MTYAKQTWVDNTTPVDAAHMSHIEDGIATVEGEIPAIPAVVNGQWLKGVGGAMVWSAITPADVGVPKVTTGTFAAGPPASPAVGDRWVATSAFGNFTQWEFVYSGVGGQPWTFIGGAPLSQNYGSSTPTVTGFQQIPGTSTLTIPRAGQYLLGILCNWYTNNAATGLEQWIIGPGPNATNVTPYVWLEHHQLQGATNNWHTGFGQVPIPFTAGQVIYINAYVSTATYIPYQTVVTLLPQQVA
jgi:hypothetical protein